MDFEKISLGPPCTSCIHFFISPPIALRSCFAACFAMALLSLHSLIQQMSLPGSTTTTQATFPCLFASSHPGQSI